MEIAKFDVAFVSEIYRILELESYLGPKTPRSCPVQELYLWHLDWQPLPESSRWYTHCFLGEPIMCSNNFNGYEIAEHILGLQNVHRFFCPRTERIQWEAEWQGQGLLVQDFCEKYKRTGKGVPDLKSLVGYSFIIEGKVGKERRPSLSSLSRRHIFIISSFSMLSRGVFSLRGQAKSTNYWFIHMCRENVLGTIDVLNSLGRMWGSCHHCFIVRGHVPCFSCMSSLLSKPAWFYG